MKQPRCYRGTIQAARWHHGDYATVAVLSAKTVMIEHFRVSHVVAGFVSVLVGYASSAVIVLQAAEVAGATLAQQISFMWALGIGMGIVTIALSVRYRAPVLAAWSTSGAALLVTALTGATLPEAIGAFLLSSALLLAVGLLGWTDIILRYVPRSVAAAMLAGVLLRFGTGMFGVPAPDLVLVLVMVAVYLLGKRRMPNYAVLASVGAGALIALINPGLHLDKVQLSLAGPVFTWPEFSPAVLIGAGVPLFLVTMSSQNLTGMATLRAHGYDTPASPLIAALGATGLVLGAAGGFAYSVAAISAAVCMTDDAEPDPKRRYLVTIWAGIFYVLAGIFAATVVGLLAALPRTLVLAITGVALLATISNSLAAAAHDERERDAAMLTFLCTASGMSLWGVGSAFWGLMLGIAVMQLHRLKAAKPS